ncbi:unnamed protein product [Caretta caretta]
MLTSLEWEDYELWKTSIIDRELHQFGIDIAALNEMRLSEIGSLDEVNYHFYWSGKPDYDPRIHGVGFTVKKAVLRAWTPPVPINERIMRLDGKMNLGTLTLLSIYRPPLDYSKEQKDKFYSQLEQIIIPAKNRFTILGDFNACVDDPGFVSNSSDELQVTMNKLSDACTNLGMVINNKKTVVMSQGTKIPPKIHVNNKTLDNVDHFCYLSSILTGSLNLERELDARISKASVTFGKLTSLV